MTRSWKVDRETNHWAVGRRHANTDLVSRRNIVDPQLVKVLVSRHSGEERRSNDGFGEHFVKGKKRVVADLRSTVCITKVKSNQIKSIKEQEDENGRQKENECTTATKKGLPAERKG